MAIQVQTTRAPPDDGRAKRWGCSPFFAQWIANVVHFCHHTSEGRAAFRKWYVRASARALRAVLTAVLPTGLQRRSRMMQYGYYVSNIWKLGRCRTSRVRTDRGTLHR
jgi:hypothetical protein